MNIIIGIAIAIVGIVLGWLLGRMRARKVEMGLRRERYILADAALMFYQRNQELEARLKAQAKLASDNGKLYISLS